MPPICEPTLKDLRIALCIAEMGSFRRAARRLDIAPSTLSRALSALEQSLGLRLFHRTTRSIAVTPEGAVFLQKIEPLVAELGSALTLPKHDHDGVRGTLRINVSFSAALYLLQEIVPAFHSLHPMVEIELHHEERMVDIIASGCDAGIRLGRTVPGDMLGVNVGGPVRWVAVASPDYVSRCGQPVHPEDLLDHQCIRIRMPDGKKYHWEFSQGEENLEINVSGSLTLDRMALMVEAALNGFGIAYVMKQTVEHHIASGKLLLLLPDWLSEEEGYMLYYPGKRVPPPPLDAFVRFLKSIARGR